MGDIDYKELSIMIREVAASAIHYHTHPCKDASFMTAEEVRDLHEGHRAKYRNNNLFAADVRNLESSIMDAVFRCEAKELDNA